MKDLLLHMYLFILLAGCAPSELPQETPENSIAAQFVCSSTISSEAPVVGESFSANDSIGIYVCDITVNPNNTRDAFKNRLFISDGEEGLAGDNISLTEGKNYDVYAYFPYRGKVEDATQILYSRGEDVMTVDKTQILNASKSNSVVSLLFQHRTSQVSFIVDFEASNLNPDSNSSIEIKGFHEKGKLNLTNGVITPEGELETFRSVFNNGKLLLDPLCFFPTDAPLELTISFNYFGKTISKKVLKTFLPGESTNFRILISSNTSEISLDASIVPWQEVTGEILVGKSTN